MLPTRTYFPTAREREMVRLTSDAIEGLHKAIKAAPDVDTVEEEQPHSLKATLMPHQRRALAWLLWRERQLPPGGILGEFGFLEIWSLFLEVKKNG